MEGETVLPFAYVRVCLRARILQIHNDQDDIIPHSLPLFSFQAWWFSKREPLILDCCGHRCHYLPCGPLGNESILEVLFHFILKFSFVEIPCFLLFSVVSFSFLWLRNKWIHFELRKWHGVFFFHTWEICVHNYISVKPPHSQERLAVFSLPAMRLYNFPRTRIKKCRFADCFEYYRILL